MSNEAARATGTTMGLYRDSFLLQLKSLANLCADKDEHPVRRGIVAKHCWSILVLLDERAHTSVERLSVKAMAHSLQSTMARNRIAEESFFSPPFESLNVNKGSRA